MSQEITYESYTDKTFIIKCDKEKYGDMIRNIGGKWQTNLKIGPSFVLLKTREPQLKKIIETVNEKKKEDVEKEIEKQDKKKKLYDRKTHRSRSIDKIKRTSSSSSDDSDFEFYKNLSKKHNEFKLLYDKKHKIQNDEESSSEEESSSSSSSSDEPTSDEREVKLFTNKIKKDK